MKISLLITFSFAIIVSCGSPRKETAVYRLPENAEVLLAGTESKTWKLAKRTNGETRVNMNDCTMAFRQTFSRDYQIKDNNEENNDCGPSIKGNWQLVQDKEGQAFLTITDEIIPTLFKVKEGSSTKFFKIVTLTDSMVIYRFPHQLFSNRTTIIEDILVPEDAPDEGRYYHF